MTGEVWDIGYLGDVSIYHVRLASGAVVRCTQANRYACCNGRSPGRTGSG